MPELSELLEWVDSHINYERTGPKPGTASDAFAHDPARRLRHLREYMELMDNPHLSYPSIHITGTNGKTSTARLISALLDAQGLTSGMYTSPHLERVNERIVANEEPIADEDLAEVLEALRMLEPMVTEKPSYFELFTAAAFRYFADKPVEVGVIEVGVGGQWDATNIIDAAVAVVTNVGLDHLNYLGPTREHIAEQKAGIVKPDSGLVLSETDPDIAKIFLERPHQRDYLLNRDFGVDKNTLAVGGRVLDLRTPLACYDDVYLSLHGLHQATNAATALMAVEAFFEQPLAEPVVREALGNVKSPGRMEVVHRQPLVILDGAHNSAGAAALIKSVDEEFGADTPRILVVGMLSPHEPVEMLGALNADGARMVIACSPDYPRAVPAEAVAEAARTLGVATVVVPDVAGAVQEALEAAGGEEIVLVTGSLYVIGAARRCLAGLRSPVRE